MTPTNTLLSILNVNLSKVIFFLREKNEDTHI